MLAERVEGMHHAHVYIRASTAHASVLMVRQNESTIYARLSSYTSAIVKYATNYSQL